MRPFPRWGATIIVLLGLATCCFAKNKGNETDSTNTYSLVTAVSPTADGGTVTISGGEAPFVVNSSTTITVDGQAGTFADIHVGMQVVSHTLPDSSQSEIDVKTVPAEPAKGKKGKKKTSTDTDSQ